MDLRRKLTDLDVLRQKKASDYALLINRPNTHSGRKLTVMEVLQHEKVRLENKTITDLKKQYVQFNPVTNTAKPKHTIPNTIKEETVNNESNKTKIKTPTKPGSKRSILTVGSKFLNLEISPSSNYKINFSVVFPTEKSNIEPKDTQSSDLLIAQSNIVYQDELIEELIPKLNEMKDIIGDILKKDEPENPCKTSNHRCIPDIPKDRLLEILLNNTETAQSKSINEKDVSVNFLIKNILKNEELRKCSVPFKKKKSHPLALEKIDQIRNLLDRMENKDQ